MNVKTIEIMNYKKSFFLKLMLSILFMFFGILIIIFQIIYHIINIEIIWAILLSLSLISFLWAINQTKKVIISNDGIEIYAMFVKNCMPWSDISECIVDYYQQFIIVVNKLNKIQFFYIDVDIKPEKEVYHLGTYKRQEIIINKNFSNVCYIFMSIITLSLLIFFIFLNFYNTFTGLIILLMLFFISLLAIFKIIYIVKYIIVSEKGVTISWDVWKKEFDYSNIQIFQIFDNKIKIQINKKSHSYIIKTNWKKSNNINQKIFLISK